MAWRILSALMSTPQMSGWIHLSSVQIASVLYLCAPAALAVHIIQRKEQMLQTTFEKCIREPARWVSQEQVLKLSHNGPLNDALMLPFRSVNREHVQSCPHVPVPRVRRIRLAENLISPKLVSTGFCMIPRENLQCHIVVVPVSDVIQNSACARRYGEVRMGAMHCRFRASHTVEVDPNPNFPTT